jgi:hypothetical protein
VQHPDQIPNGSFDRGRGPAQLYLVKQRCDQFERVYDFLYLFVIESLNYLYQHLQSCLFDQRIRVCDE